MSRTLRWSVLLFALLTGLGWVRCGAIGDAWFAGSPDVQLPLADAVAERALRLGGQAGIGTGSARFDGEWDLGTCQMTVLGLSQVIHQHPETRDRYLPAIDACLDWLITPESRAFGTRAWGMDALEGPAGTHAYMGYVNVALSTRRTLGSDVRYDALNDRLTAALAAGLHKPIHHFHTYPRESYPVDLSTVAASIALYDQATGADHRAALDDWLRRYRAAAVDPVSGMLFQSLHPETGTPVDAPRGSGTAFAAYFLAAADPGLSAELYQSLQHRNVVGLGGIREYPLGTSGWGDVDSGPVLLGVSVSATGFALASARREGDAEGYRRIYRTAHLFGVPFRGRFLTGGGIGNAILLAMLTAPAP